MARESSIRISAEFNGVDELCKSKSTLYKLNVESDDWLEPSVLFGVLVYQRRYGRGQVFPSRRRVVVVARIDQNDPDHHKRHMDLDLLGIEACHPCDLVSELYLGGSA